MWFFVPIPSPYRVARRCTRRRYYRGCSRRRDTEQSQAGRGAMAFFFISFFAWCGVLDNLPKPHPSWLWIPMAISMVIITYGGWCFGKWAYEYRTSRGGIQQSPPPPPPPPSSFDWEPPDPLPGPRPLNRQAPIDRPYPFRSY
jgi:hypothetical protein